MCLSSWKRSINVWLLRGQVAATTSPPTKSAAKPAHCYVNVKSQFAIRGAGFVCVVLSTVFNLTQAAWQAVKLRCAERGFHLLTITVL